MHLVGLSCLHPPGSLSIGIATQCALRVGKRRAPNNKNHIRKSKGQRRTRTDRQNIKGVTIWRQRKIKEWQFSKFQIHLAAPTLTMNRISTYLRDAATTTNRTSWQSMTTDLHERRNRRLAYQQQSITFADNQAVYAMLMATDTSLTPLPHSPAPRSQAICLISPLHHSIIDHCPCTKIHRSLGHASVAASHWQYCHTLLFLSGVLQSKPNQAFPHQIIINDAIKISSRCNNWCIFIWVWVWICC